MAELQKRMDKIDLRDTIKLCIKYLYKILRSKFKETDEVNYFGMRLRKSRKYWVGMNLNNFNILMILSNILIFQV